jgi:hypothetical protein
MSMRRSSQLVFVFIAATVIAAIGSHLVVDWLKLKVKSSEPLTFGNPNSNPPAFRAGSSLADYQIKWEQIAAQTGTEIKAWGIAGGSPYEFEQFQKKVPEARTTYIVISAYDMDEANICDFRAALVPLSDTIESLWAIHADWDYSAQAISQYPMTWLRTVFPTLGFSRDIMGRIRERMVKLLRPSNAPSETMAGPTLAVGKEKVVDNYRLQKVSDWSESQILDKLVAMRAGFQGRDDFNGPKNLAFLKMLEYGCQRGPTIVIVVPESAAYSKYFMTPTLTLQYEAALADAHRQYPKVEWLRLDQVPGLASDHNFCDLVHMNVYGQTMATEDFLAWLKQPDHQP